MGLLPGIVIETERVRRFAGLGDVELRIGSGESEPPRDDDGAGSANCTPMIRDRRAGGNVRC